MDVLRVVRGPRAMARWAVASLVMNIVIVVTGALVRLTGSGLGCPTWPRCTTESYVSHPALGIHGAIEFGNRLLFFVLAIIAIFAFVAALFSRHDARFRRDLVWLTAAMFLAIPFQGVIGGITVLTQLNPYVVALHLVLSMVLIALAVWLVRKTWRPTPTIAPARSVLLTRVIFVLIWAAVWIGTTVTGSGPHAGAENAPRNGLNGGLATDLHAYTVYTATALTVLAVVVLRSRAAWLLLGVELIQASVGIAQYRLGLPIGLVVLHLLGASLAIAAATNLMLATRKVPKGDLTPDRAEPRAERAVAA